MPDLTLSGTTAGQAVTDAASLSPFAGVALASSAAATPYVAATVALPTTADGALSHLGIGTLSADGSTYTVKGSPADVQAALRGLVFTPAAHEVPVGRSVATGFTITASDAAGAVTDARTSVVATAADTPPTITDTSAMQVPTASNASNPNGPGVTSFTPFAYTTITDPDAGAAETTSIKLAQNGVATDAVGLLSGASLTKTGVGAYTLAVASPSAATSALQALRFTPINPDAGATLAVTLSVSDDAGASAVATSSIGVAADPGGETVISNSFTSTTTFNDTPSTSATHTYATVVDGVLSNGMVVYDQTFNLPYSDPQVQAAIGQAKSAVQNAGQTSNSPTQAASNLTTLTSQTAVTQTGSSTSQSVISTPSAFGPDYIGPNTSVAGDADRGFLHVQSGQTAIDINTATTTTVNRTVTTTSTDLLSQQYLVTGSASTAMPSPTLVSTNASGQGGNAESVFPVYSPDGTNLLLLSDASNLVPGVTPGGDITFIKNLATGVVTLVGSSAAGATGNGGDGFGENQQEFSGDGTQVVFNSTSSNLVAGDGNGASDIFVKNLSTGAVTLVSTGPQGQANGASLHAAFSPVANRVLFESVATNLVAGVASGLDQIYLKDLGTNAVTLVSSSTAGVVGNAASQYPEFTPDGTRAVFYSRATNLSPGDTDSLNDVYLKNLSTGTLSLLSVNAAGTKLNGNSFFPQFSPDGTKVAFFTEATNAGFTNPNGLDELVVRDLTTGAITLVSAAADGTPGNANSDAFAWSHDGTQIAFGSAASNLVAGDTNGTYDVFVKTLSTGAVSLVSTGASGEGNGVSDRPSFAPNGSTLAFDSRATNFSTADANGNAFDIYTVPLAAATTPPVNTPPTITGVPPTEADPGQAAFMPFPTALASDPDAGQTFTVTLDAYNAQTGEYGGYFTGGGFVSVAGGFYAGTVVQYSSTSIAAVQAALRAVNFTPAVADTQIHYSISDGSTSTGGAVEIVSTPAAPTNTPPAIGGTQANQATNDKATIAPFSTVTVTDPDAGQTETVTVTYTAANGTLAGGGFTGTAGSYSAAFASAAQAQAGLQALVFTPTANEVAPGQTAATGFTVAVGDGQTTTTNTGASVVVTSVNDPPVLGGLPASQAATAGVTTTPFAAATVADLDTGQSETVTVSFAPAAGVFSGAGFTGSNGVFSATFGSAAAAQAALRGASFTPFGGMAASDTLTVAVQDAPGGGAPAAASTTLAVAYTAPPPSPGGGAVATAPTTPLSVQSGLAVEFQNLTRSLPNGADANTPGTQLYAQWQSYKAVAAQLDNGQISQGQAESALDHLVDGTTAVAVSTYAFFTGFTPTAQGLDYLVHSANPTDLNDPYYARFSTENRYINFAVNLATGAGAGAAAFQANYGSLSLADATAKAYLAVFGTAADAAKVSALLNTLVPDGLGGQETRATYFAQYGGDGPNGQGTKAAMVGFLLSNGIAAGSGVYGAATEHYLAALAHGAAPPFGSELALTYGTPVNLVGVAPAPDPTVTG